jgi:uroporphyrin-III C-methyltransferase/precorrin-2 dehydrogenase/sirohydrochlorin ferrochelatase
MNHISSLPVLLANPKILLIGGGNVAYGKAKVLKENNIDFEIISYEITDELAELNIPAKKKKFAKTDIAGYNIIVDATGSQEVMNIILEAKKERFLLVNFVDIPQYCDFYFSALLQYKNLKIAVSSDGASPTLSQMVRDQIKKIIPGRIEKIAEKKWYERMKGKIDAAKTRNEVRESFGKVFIVGCGTGDPNLLTLKALKTFEIVDIVLYDYLISNEILSLLPDHVEKVYSGKPKGRHHNDQELINNMLLKYALEGKRVARLKSGDPFVFGRGAEEAEFLIKHNVEVEIIPGISSALVAPLSAGIPVTSRGFSTSFSVITGCLKGETVNLKLPDLLKLDNHTTIVLMGLSYAAELVSLAAADGVRKNLPCAVISNASRINQKIVTGVLENLTDLVKESASPAVIVFGDVVRFSEILSKNTYCAEYVDEGIIRYIAYIKQAV